MSDGLRPDANVFVPRATAPAWQPSFGGTTNTNTNTNTTTSTATTTNIDGDTNNINHHSQYYGDDHHQQYQSNSNQQNLDTSATSETAHNDGGSGTAAYGGHQQQQQLKPMFFFNPSFYPGARGYFANNLDEEPNSRQNDNESSAASSPSYKVTYQPAPASSNNNNNDNNNKFAGEDDSFSSSSFPDSTLQMPGTYILMQDGETYQWFDRETAAGSAAEADGFDLDHFIYHQQLSQMMSSLNSKNEDLLPKTFEEFDLMWQAFEDKRRQDIQEALAAAASETTTGTDEVTSYASVNHDFYDPTDNSSFYYYTTSAQSYNNNNMSSASSFYSPDSTYGGSYNNNYGSSPSSDYYYRNGGSSSYGKKGYHRGGGGRGGGRGSRGGGARGGGRGRGSNNNNNQKQQTQQQPQQQELKKGFYFDGKKYYDIEHVLSKHPDTLDEDEKTFAERYRRIQASKKAHELVLAEYTEKVKTEENIASDDEDFAEKIKAKIDENDPVLKKRERQLYYEQLKKQMDEINKKFEEERLEVERKEKEEAEKKQREEEEKLKAELEKKDAQRLRRLAKRKRQKMRKQAMQLAEAVAAGVVKIDKKKEKSHNDDDSDDDSNSSGDDSDENSSNNSDEDLAVSGSKHDNSNSNKNVTTNDGKKIHLSLDSSKQHVNSSNSAVPLNHQSITIPNHETGGTTQLQLNDISPEVLEFLGKNVKFEKNEAGKMVPVMDTSADSLNEFLPESLKEKLKDHQQQQIQNSKLLQQQQQQQKLQNQQNASAATKEAKRAQLLKKARGLTADEKMKMKLKDHILNALHPLVPYSLGNSTNLVMTAMRKICGEPLLNIHVDQRPFFLFGNRASTPAEFVVTPTCSSKMPWAPLEQQNNNNSSSSSSSSALSSHQHYSSTSSQTTCHFHQLPKEEFSTFCKEFSIIFNKNRDKLFGNHSNNNNTITISIPFGQKTKVASSSPYFFLSSSSKSTHAKIIRNLALEFVTDDEEREKLRTSDTQKSLSHILEANGKESTVEQIVTELKKMDDEKNTNNQDSSSLSSSFTPTEVIRDITPLVLASNPIFKRYSFLEIVDLIVIASSSSSSLSSSDASSNKIVDEALRKFFFETICHDLFIKSIKEYHIDIVTTSSSSSSSSAPSRYLLRTTEAQIKQVSVVSKEGNTKIRFPTSSSSSSSSQQDDFDLWSSLVNPFSVSVCCSSSRKIEDEQSKMTDTVTSSDELKMMMELAGCCSTNEAPVKQDVHHAEVDNIDEVVSNNNKAMTDEPTLPSQDQSSSSSTMLWAASAVLFAGAGVLLLKLK